jgi:hypothetical protein
VKPSPYFRASTQWLLSLELSALTVAGQWRIFTALPINQEWKVIYAAETPMSMAFGKLVDERIEGGPQGIHQNARESLPSDKLPLK